MTRALSLIALCSLALALPTSQAAAAPGAKKAPSKSAVKKGKPKAKKTTVKKKSGGKKVVKKSGKTRTVKAKGPAMGRRQGLPLVKIAPKGTEFDDDFNEMFGEMEVKSESGGKVSTAAMKKGVGLTQVITNAVSLTAARPAHGGVYFRTYKGDLRAGYRWGQPPRLDVRPDGGVVVYFPLIGNESADFKVECGGELPNRVKLETGVAHDSGWYAVSRAEFSNVGSTLKFIVSTPNTERKNPLFSVALRSKDDSESWALESCSIERI